MFKICTFLDSLQKRDLEDVQDAIDDQLPKGNVCVNDDQCSFIEVCDNLSGGLSFHCKFAPWFIWTVIGVAAAVLISLLVSCICCPCCCLYAMCRKG